MFFHQHLVASFLILSMTVVSLAVPFILEENGTSVVWVLEGAMLLWIGVWKQQLLLRVTGLLLQGCGAYVFLDAVFYPLFSTVFANRHFYSCLFIGCSGLYSSHMLERELDSLRTGEKWFVPVLLAWGLLWWYFAGMREIASHLLVIESHNAFLLYSCAVIIVMTIASRKLQWSRLGYAQLLFLPVAAGCGVVGWLSLPGASHLLAGKGWIVWGVAVFCQFRLLHHYDGTWPRKLTRYYYTATLCLLTVLACHEIDWLVVTVFGFSTMRGLAFWLLLPAFAVFIMVRRGKSVSG